MGFKKAERTQTKARIMLSGFSGSGKTRTSLEIAKRLAEGGDIFVINTENVGEDVGTSSVFSPFVEHMSTVVAPPFKSSDFINAINEAVKEGAAVIIIDSASHQWQGILNYVGDLEKSAKNKASVWNKATPVYDKFMETVMNAPCHMIVTYRVEDKVELGEGGKVVKVPEKIQAPKGNAIENEYSISLYLDKSGTVSVEKSRYNDFPITSYDREDPNFYELILSVHNTGRPLPPTREGFISLLARYGYTTSDQIAMLKEDVPELSEKWSEESNEEMVSAFMEFVSNNG